MAITASTGKPASISGAVYVGAANAATLPTDATTEMSTLSASFKSVGYISEDGITNSISIDSEEIKCWGGVTVINSITGKTDTFKFTMISPLEPEALKIVFGDSNVTETSGALTVKQNGTEPAAHSFVIELTVANKARRICIPNAKLSDLGDISYKDGDAIGYEVTITCLADSNNNTHYEYTAA